MNPSAVLFRCDAIEKGGAGHLVRCLALAEAVAATSAATIHLAGDFRAALAQTMLSRVDVHLQDSPPDTKGLIALARDLDASIIHVDSYGEYPALAAEGQAAGIVTSTATDASFGRRAADVIIDGSLTALRQFDELYSDADLCIGPQFLPLRRGLLDSSRRGEVSGRDLDVLVLMGGTDAAGIGLTVVDALHTLPGIDRVGLVGSSSHTKVLHVERTPDVAAMMAEWDLVVTAAGTTVWELAAMGIPMAIVGVAENQRDQYDNLIRGGCATGLGFLATKDAVDHDALTVSALVDALADRDILRRRVTTAGALVDGHGAERVIQVWTEVLARQASRELRSRVARFSDAGRLFAWRNNAHTRAASRSTGEVKWADHVRWLRSGCARSDQLLFVVELMGKGIGTARFDERSQGDWEVSLTVAPESRGRGLAALIVAEASNSMVSTLERDGRPARRLTAELRVENGRSRAVFLRLGYRLDTTAGGWERWVREV